MPRVFRTGPSKTDIHNIATYIAKDNMSAARQLLARFDNTLSLIAASPQVGLARPDIGVHLRSFVVGSYSLYYRPMPDGIILLRVLHNAQDVHRQSITN